MISDTERHAKRAGITLTVLLSAMVLLNYMDRGALGIAAPRLKEELGLSATQFGLAVSAFAWIYAPAQFAVGWLLSRVCVYRLVAVGLFVWALATTAMGFVSSLAMLVALRILLGIGEGVAFPSASAVIARHIAPERRGIANSVVNSSLAFGPAIGTFAGGMILAASGWRHVFLTFGLVTFLWLVPWLLLSKPHWRAAEPAEGRVTMSEVVREPTTWLIGVGHFFNTYGFFFLLAWLPLFLVKSRGFTILEMTKLATAVYIVQGVTALLTGWWSDRLIAAGRDEGRVRKAFMALGLAGVALAIAGAGLSVSREALSAWLLFAGVACAPGGAQAYAIAQVYAGKRAAGPFVGAMNGIGNLSGVIGPVVTGLIVDHAGYLPAFMAAAAMPALGAFWWWFVLPEVKPVIGVPRPMRDAASPSPA